MEIMGTKLGMTEEDKKIVLGYLSPYIKQAASNQVKKVAGYAGKKAALKVVRVADAKLSDTDYKKIKFIVSKTKQILEKPELEKMQAKEEKNKSKEEKKIIKLEKKKEKRKLKIKAKRAKLKAKGKLSLKQKLVSNAILTVGGYLL